MPDRMAAPPLAIAAGAGRRRRLLAGESYGIGRTATPEEIAGWDIDVSPNGAGLPPGRGDVAAGRGDLRREMRLLPWRPRRGQADGPARRRLGHAARQEARKDSRQLLALCDDAVRLCAPRHAARTRRSRSRRTKSTRFAPTCCSSTGSCRWTRRSTPTMLAEDQNAEPQRLRQRLSGARGRGQTLAAAGTRQVNAGGARQGRQR